MVRYSYDAWGSHVSITGSMANTLGQYNPFRYRGYYYDNETGMYYLNARYYNPYWCRFISPDPVIDTGSAVGCNPFVYSNNNPVGTVSAGLAESVFEKTTKSIGGLAERIAQASVVFYDVPLYNQNGYSLCWAFCQVMVEDFQSGITRTNVQATKKAIKIAKSVNGENWNRGNWPTNCVDERKNPIFASGINSLKDLYNALEKNGPIYGYYWDGRDRAHLIVITGVDYTKGLVYTNNPWGIYGKQEYADFLAGVAGDDPSKGMVFRHYLFTN